MKRILVIEDDVIVQRMVKSILGQEFELIPCTTIHEAIKFLKSPDLGSNLSLVLLDRGLPDGDGLTVCSLIRGELQMPTLPIIFLTGANSESDKLSGFFSGADDYITKPFSLLELKARVFARLRNTSTTQLNVGFVEVNLETHRAYLKNNDGKEEIQLTRLEFKMLVIFMQALDHVFSREMLLDKVWGNGSHVTDRVVDSHVSHLRKKLVGTGLSIESLRGEGYRMKMHQNPNSRAV